MCGITGFFETNSIIKSSPADRLRSMTEALAHRGPDDSGIWVDEAAGVFLGHRRLSIVDLSTAGHQPMVSSSGRYVIAYNGEVYNHREIDNSLRGSAGHRKGHSDTETMLRAIEELGLGAALNLFNGMFAFACWDRELSVMHLVRDRMGIKPLYYAADTQHIAFGSEMTPILRYLGHRPAIDTHALSLFLKYKNVPAPFTIFEGVNKLEPGTRLEISQAQGKLSVKPVVWWSFSNLVSDAKRNPVLSSDTDVVDLLETTLTDAVKRRMIADVPLGAFLSGGIDSSTVVALMQKIHNEPVKTFSIGFGDMVYDEAPFASKVAGHLGTEHTELYVSDAEARDIIPSLPFVFDEPFADSSQIPTILVSKLARESVTVSLSGDGGDELFGGYYRHLRGPSLWSGIKNIPVPVRRLLSRTMTNTAISAMFEGVNRILPVNFRVGQPAEKWQKLAGVLSAATPAALYDQLTADWKHPEDLVLGPGVFPALKQRETPDGLSFSEQMMFWDAVDYLHNDVLTKVDRSSMSVALEARVPLLDHTVAELAWRIPLDKKIRNGQGKWALRQVLHRHVPEALFERPKMGFAVPIDHWLRGPLKDWAGDMLGSEALKRAGYINHGPVEKAWNDHISGKRDNHHPLWSVLMFQAWFDTMDDRGRSEK